MEKLQECSQHYIDGLRTPKEFIAEVVGILANHWESIPASAIGDELANQLALIFQGAKVDG